MKPFLWCVVLAVAVQTSAAFALGRIADVEIIDRDSGTILSPHYYRGEYWVAGRPGARYAIRIRNYAGGRILAVTSVDGVNVLSGEDASFGQDGYVFYPTQEYEITGWRKSRAEVAAFTFTDAASSYAGLTGRSANIGVIGVALFPERAYIPPPITHVLPQLAPAPSAAAEALQAPSARSQTDAFAGALAPAAPLGTGHGERESSPVEFVDFQRQDPQPAEVIRIRYDSMENLLARGIIRRPPPRRPTSVPEPFPAEPSHFVPDPPG